MEQCYICSHEKLYIEDGIKTFKIRKLEGKGMSNHFNLQMIKSY